MQRPPFTTPVALGSLLVLAAIAPHSARSDQPLFDFTGAQPIPEIQFTDASARLDEAAPGKRLRVKTGHRETWPGIRLTAPSGHWDLSPFAAINLTLRNSGSNQVAIYCRVDNAGADGSDHCVTGSLTLAAGASGVLSVGLKRVGEDNLQGKLFGMRGYPVGQSAKGTVDPTHITQLLIFVSKPAEDHYFDVGKIQAVGTYTPPTASVTDASPFFPFIDTLGQYRHKTWPGKAQSVAELQTRREQEREEISQHPGPVDWDKYGGWATGPKLRATGFFRTEKVGSKWWLIDPEGRLFFSHGIDCVRQAESTPIEERAEWFEDFPGADPAFKEFFSSGYALKGHYAGRTVRCFSFVGANLRRKYGPDWARVYPRFIHQRLRSWGLNTIANWSDENTCLLRQTAYTDSVGSHDAPMIEGSEGYWGKFPDVFDPSFASSVRRSMESKRGKSAGDPWCLGYFSDNEMSWGDELSLALGALKSPPSQAAKRALLEELKAKYVSVEKLNEAWGSTYGSWDKWLESTETPDLGRARADLAAFYTKSAERYFQTVRAAIKTLAPDQLYLGCRFAWVNPRAAAAAAKYCDVVSYNLYQRSVANFKFNGEADVPLIIGEFHLGALDRGLFHTGLVPVNNQQERASTYEEYVRGALHHSQFVGCHWFQYADEPVTGRVYDEENYQIGFVDVADTPYAETIQASREVGYNLYRNGGH